MKLLLVTIVSTALAGSALAQTPPHTAGSTLGSPTVPGTVRTDSPGISSTNAAPANDGPSISPVPTDNAPIRQSDLTTETTQYPPTPSLRPWAPTTTGPSATKAPPH
jgi:hypothetical protein